MTEDWQHKIEDYLAGKLSGDEREAFEQQMTGDKSLRDQVELYRESELLLQLAAREKLKSQVREWDQSQRQVSSFLPLRWMAAAVVITILLAGGYWWVLPPDQPDKLYVSYFEPYPDRLTELGESDTRRQQAMNHYREGNYDSCLFYQNQLTLTLPEQIYKGIALLETDHTTEAAELFSTLKNEPSNLQETAWWYLILTYLKQQNFAEARRELEIYLQRDPPLYQEEKARQLLDHLPE